MNHRALTLLGELRDALPETYSETAALKWWDRVLSAEAELEHDPNHSAEQRELARQVRAEVTEFMTAHRDALNAQLGPVLVAIGNLEASIKRGAVGEDGFPAT